MSQVSILSETCKGVEDCGICLLVCPKGLFEPSEATNQAGYLPPRVSDPAQCTACNNCMLFCPDLAVVVQKDESEASR